VAGARAPARNVANSPDLAEPGLGDPKLAHVWFGSILGEDGKPFKTRSGETVKLADLLDEAEERAFKIVSEKNPDLPEAQRREIARVVGLGAVKYADLLRTARAIMFSVGIKCSRCKATPRRICNMPTRESKAFSGKMQDRLPAVSF